MVGAVVGDVTQDQEYHRFWGIRLLLVTLLFFGLMVLQALRTGAGGGTKLIAIPLHPVILLAVLGAILLTAIGGGLGGYFRGRGRGARRTVVSAQGGAGAPRPSPTEMAVTVRRFRVRTMTSDVHACMLVGDLVGDDIRQGDIVRVRGRRDRSGVLVAKSVEIMTSHAGPVAATVIGRPPAGFTAARIADQVGKVLGLLALFWILLSLTGILG